MSAAKMSATIVNEARFKNEQFTPEKCEKKFETLESSDKSERMNILVREQVDMIKESQDRVQHLVENINLTEEEVDLSTVESVKDIVRKSEDLIVMVRIIIKVRNELGYARLDLEKAKKAKTMVNEAQERFQWLEKRLEKLLSQCYERASNLLKTTTVSSLGTSLASTYLSANVEERFSSSQCQRMFSDVGEYCAETPEKYQDGKRKCYNVTKNVLDNSEKLLQGENEHSLNKGESSSSLQTETLADLEGNKDEQHPEVLAQTPVLPPTDDPNYIPNAYPRLSLEEASETDSQSSLDDEDGVDRYWKSDHHRFEWPDVSVRQRSPLSWHSLGLPVQDSFIAKDRPVFTPDLPWKEKATQVNSVLDIHKIALDKLYARLHHMYEVIERATEASINPVPKNDKIEARMKNVESATKAREATSKTSIADNIEEPGELEDPTPSLEIKTLDIEEASGEHSTKSPRLLFPRNSSVWCASKTSAGGRVVKKIKTKPPAQPSKSKAILAKKILESNDPNIQQLEKQEAMIWRPSIVYKMVKATKVLRIFQAQLQQWDAARRCTQKWKRVQWLMGPNGLCSPTKEIVIEALKTLSELRCSEEEVGSALKNILYNSEDPRVLYEASRALILSGHFETTAIEILQNALKLGSKSLKQEILDALCSVEDIPFFKKKSKAFREILVALEELVKSNEPCLAFSSALCLGKMFVVHPVAKEYLMKTLRTNSLAPTQKSRALNVLVRQMNIKDKTLVELLLHELNTSINWKVRVQACDLLMFIGNRHVLAMDVEDIFEILERLLWDHAHQEVRSKVAELLNTLRLRSKACGLVLRRLDDPEETVRARAIISLATLEMKGEKELKALLDILALDSSVYARIQVVRAFSKLRWNDSRVLRSLKEREKGEGILAREARKALEQLS